jgi:hypothetical protein
VIEAPAGESQAGRDVLQLEVGQFIQNLLLCQSRREKIEDIDDTDPHASNARPTSTLGGIDGDAFEQLGHDEDRTADAVRLPEAEELLGQAGRGTEPDSSKSNGLKIREAPPGSSAPPRSPAYLADFRWRERQ